jgi:hypothetical protein
MTVERLHSEVYIMRPVALGVVSVSLSLPAVGALLGVIRWLHTHDST